MYLTILAEVESNANVINVELWQLVLSVGVIVASVIGTFATLKNDVKHINKELDTVRKDAKEYGKDIASINATMKAIQDSVNGLSAQVLSINEAKYAVANSPRKLTGEGKKVLKGSGIKDAIDSNKQELLLLAEQRNPLTAYDAEECVMELIRDYFTDEDHQDVNNIVKNKTFAMGQNIDIVYFVGGIYFRDIALPKMGFKLDDIDKNKK